MREKTKNEAVHRLTESSGCTSVDAILDEMAECGAGSCDRSATWAAEVVNERHPDLLSRVEVRWSGLDDAQPTTRWVPTTRGLPVRCGDRVLLQQPENWPEPIVIAIIDGYAPRAPQPKRSRPVELRKDEAIEIHGHRGTPLVTIHEGDSGPVVQILSEHLHLEAAGHLKLSGRTVELRATEGSAEIEAQEDVVVRGETIHLN